MLTRNCSGGLVFRDDSVLLLCNEKQERAFPKGVIRSETNAESVAIERVRNEAGIQAMILAPAGKTLYEFYSITRQMPVCNRIMWYVMKTSDDDEPVQISSAFSAGGFFPVLSALEKITYSQDRSLLMMAYQKYKELV